MSRSPEERERVRKLRQHDRFSLDEIIAETGLSRSTIYGWIKDMPLSAEEIQLRLQRPTISEARKAASQANSDRAKERRQSYYAQGLEEAPELLKDPHFRDFVILYMGEGYKKTREAVSIANSDPHILGLANQVMLRFFTPEKLRYSLQYHADQDPEKLKIFWRKALNLAPDRKFPDIRKSNSSNLEGRKWNSLYGVVTVRGCSVEMRCRLEGWIDTVRSDWGYDPPILNHIGV